MNLFICQLQSGGIGGEGETSCEPGGDLGDIDEVTMAVGSL